MGLYGNINRYNGYSLTMYIYKNPQNIRHTIGTVLPTRGNLVEVHGFSWCPAPLNDHKRIIRTVTSTNYTSAHIPLSVWVCAGI